jgi:ABC-type transporter Mla MlaB component
LTVECNETHWILRLDGDYSLGSAAELKALLLAGLASGNQMEIDLARAGEIDVTVLQLLWAAAREAARESRGFLSRVPESVTALAREAGFESFPGVAGGAGAAVEDEPGVEG